MILLRLQTRRFQKIFGEVSVNYLGANILGGAIQTKGQKTDQDFIKIVTDNAKLNGNLITLAGHSGGGLRNFLALSNSSPNQYLDNNGNSVLQVQFSGTPANYYDILQVSKNAGAGEVQKQNNSGDFVSNVLGMNGDIFESIWSAMNVVSLFEAPIKPNINKFTSDPAGFLQNPKSYFQNLESPHSNYGCILSSCASNKSLNIDSNLFPNINLNYDE